MADIVDKFKAVTRDAAATALSDIGISVDEMMAFGERVLDGQMTFPEWMELPNTARGILVGIACSELAQHPAAMWRLLQQLIKARSETET